MDVRLISALIALVLALFGYIVLVIDGHTDQAEDLLKLIALPSATWILGAGSTLRN